MTLLKQLSVPCKLKHLSKYSDCCSIKSSDKNTKELHPSPFPTFTFLFPLSTQKDFILPYKKLVQSLLYSDLFCTWLASLCCLHASTSNILFSYTSHWATTILMFTPGSFYDSPLDTNTKATHLSPLPPESHTPSQITKKSSHANKHPTQILHVPVSTIFAFIVIKKSVKQKYWQLFHKRHNWRVKACTRLATSQTWNIHAALWL